MSHIPQDMDQMMWQIAERGDVQAANEFSERFPALGQDMQDRMRMVSGMKNMRVAIAPGFVPTFTPRYLSKPKPVWMRLGPSALGLAVLAGASFYITQNLLTPLPDPSILTGDSISGVNPKREVTLPVVRPPQPSVDEGPKPFNGASSPGIAREARDTIKFGDIDLQSALKVVAHRYSIKLEIPPDFPNPTISHVELTGSSGLDFLQQLGEKYEFKTFDEGDGRILIIHPTVPPPVPDN